MNELEKELLSALKELFENPHLDLEDLVYTIREREGDGWDGNSVTQWSNAVTNAKNLLKKHS
jgi:hypothetical protein